MNKPVRFRFPMAARGPGNRGPAARFGAEA